MTVAEKERALKLVAMLKKAGDNHGLLVVAGSLVIRDGVNGAAGQIDTGNGRHS
jgi:hypothetical protein